MRQGLLALVAWLALSGLAFAQGQTTLTPTVNQGTAGTSAWKIDFTGASATVTGTVAVDQTTDGTTNKVYVGNIPHVTVDSVPSPVTMGGVDSTGVTRTIQTTSAGVLLVQPSAAIPTALLLPCNALRKQNCR